MRSIKLFTITVLTVLLISPPSAEAISDEEAKGMLVTLVHAYYDSDSETFWKIISKFEKPQFESPLIIKNWMRDRKALQETLLIVRGYEVVGMARITEEILGDIVFRFDGKVNTSPRIIIVTVPVERIIEFDKPVPAYRRRVQQIAAFKMYVTIVEEKYLSYKSDEINLGYYFAE